MNVLIHGADPFDGKTVIGQRAALADQVHTERQIGKSAAGKICLRGLYRQGDIAVLPVDFTLVADIKPNRGTQPICKSPHGPALQTGFVAQPIIGISVIETHHCICLSANTPPAPVTIIGNRGFQIIGAGAELHRVGQALAGCRHIHRCQNRTGLLNRTGWQ